MRSSAALGGGVLVSAWCGGRITHVTRTSDQLTVLVVAVWPDNLPHILAFDVRTLATQVRPQMISYITHHMQI